jgi:hypothetical protein
MVKKTHMIISLETKRKMTTTFQEHNTWNINEINCCFFLLLVRVMVFSNFQPYLFKLPVHQCLSPLTLWVRVSIMSGCTLYSIMWSSLSVTCSRSMVFSGYSSFLHRSQEYSISARVWLLYNVVRSTVFQLEFDCYIMYSGVQYFS